MNAPSSQPSRATCKSSFDFAQESLGRKATLDRSSSVQRNPASRTYDTAGRILTSSVAADGQTVSVRPTPFYLRES
jgi:hypothetical protein